MASVVTAFLSVHRLLDVLGGWEVITCRVYVRLGLDGTLCI